VKAGVDDTVIIRRKVRSNFTTLPNDLIRDPRLSWKSLGILVFVLSLPDNVRLRLSHLAKQKASGRDATRSGLKELQVAGYLVIIRVRGARGKFTNTTWAVTDDPWQWGDASPRSGFPATVNPTVDSPKVEKPTLIKTDEKKN
jgi:hypothetical protein